jgi:hypothetical protein
MVRERGRAGESGRKPDCRIDGVSRKWRRETKRLGVLRRAVAIKRDLSKPEDRAIATEGFKTPNALKKQTEGVNTTVPAKMADAGVAAVARPSSLRRKSEDRCASAEPSQSKVPAKSPFVGNTPVNGGIPVLGKPKLAGRNSESENHPDQVSASDAMTVFDLPFTVS